VLVRLRHPPTRRAAPFGRALAAVLALLLSGAPVLEAFHAALVPHVTCPEDGELIDVPANGLASRTEVAAHSHGEGSLLLAQREPAPLSVDGLGHHHCAVALQGKLRARADSKSRPAGLPRESELSPSVAPEPPRLGGLAVYLLAPKASPPLA
jgi:hypothetical protein